jgi:hypothetical protein
MVAFWLMGFTIEDQADVPEYLDMEPPFGLVILGLNDTRFGSMISSEPEPSWGAPQNTAGLGSHRCHENFDEGCPALDG